eukprot:SAG11_NODE_2243_length_3641_cov_2.533597_4_plen_38_part_00
MGVGVGGGALTHYNIIIVNNIDCFGEKGKILVKFIMV